jgi:hypothetical protein
MQFYPFDTLRLRPNNTVIWVIEQEVPQGCGGYPAVGQQHPKFEAFKATYVGGATDCAGGTIIWEAPFMAAPEIILRMVSALRAPAPAAATTAPCEGWVSCFSCNAEGVVGEVPHTGDCQDYGSC